MRVVTAAEAAQTLRRLLANGLLTGWPKRPADQEVIAALAAARFAPGATYSEAQVNDALVTWLATVSEPFGIDHVTLRRTLVDARLLVRTSTGSSYTLAQQAAEGLAPLAGVDALAIREAVAAERSARKERHRGSSPAA